MSVRIAPRLAKKQSSNHSNIASSRLYVQESIAPTFIEAVKGRFATLTESLGANPLEATTMHGPMADEAHFNRVMSYIELGKQSAQPLIGGSRKGDKGFWIEPTIFLNPDKESRVYKEEIFGPVLSIVTFKTEEEAIELANDTNTGLSGKVLYNAIYILRLTLGTAQLLSILPI